MPYIANPPPAPPSASAPVAPVVEHESLETPDRQFDDQDVGVSLAQLDRVPSIPAIQIAMIPSPEGSAFEVWVLETTKGGSPLEHDCQVNDNAMEVAMRPTITEGHEALVCAISREDASELELPSRMEEKFVDYKVGDKDCANDNDTKLPLAPEVPPYDPAKPNQVQPSGLCDFDLFQVAWSHS